MNDEIKEINLSEMLFNRDERLLDYITNLQNRITELEEINKQHQEINSELRKKIKEALKELIYDFDTQSTVFKVIDILQDKEEV